MYSVICFIKVVPERRFELPKIPVLSGKCLPVASLGRLPQNPRNREVRHQQKPTGNQDAVAIQPQANRLTWSPRSVFLRFPLLVCHVLAAFLFVFFLCPWRAHAAKYLRVRDEFPRALVCLPINVDMGRGVFDAWFVRLHTL